MYYSTLHDVHTSTTPRQASGLHTRSIRAALSTPALSTLAISAPPIYHTAVLMSSVYLTFVYHYACSILITEFCHSNDLHFGLFQTL